MAFSIRGKRARTTDHKGLATWLDCTEATELLRTCTAPTITEEDLRRAAGIEPRDIAMSELGIDLKALRTRLGAKVTGDLLKIFKDYKLLSKENDLKNAANALWNLTTFIASILKTPILKIEDCEKDNVYSQFAFLVMQVVSLVKDTIGDVAESCTYTDLGFRFVGNPGDDTDLKDLKPEGLSAYKP